MNLVIVLQLTVKDSHKKKRKEILYFKSQAEEEERKSLNCI